MSSQSKQRFWIASLCIALALVLFGAVLVHSYDWVCVMPMIACGYPNTLCNLPTYCSSFFVVNWFDPLVLAALVVAIILMLSAFVMYLPRRH